MEAPLRFESVTKGLWARFVTQLIAGWVFSFLATLIALSIFGLALVFPFVYPLVFISITWLTFRDMPRHWENIVMIDFTAETINIASKKRSRQQGDILDFDGHVIGFSDIDAYATKNYDSPIFTSYFLVTLIVKGETIKCISFKNASRFTEFVTVLSKKIGLKLG